MYNYLYASMISNVLGHRKEGRKEGDIISGAALVSKLGLSLYGSDTI